jgi:FKBP-type peptidyl-prolyl cis-trans isomerase (trigger factor)
MAEYKIKKTNTDKDCEVSLEIEVKSDALDKLKDEAIKRIGESVKIDGFRPGNIPAKVILEKVGEYSIYEEATRMFIDANFVTILQDGKHFPINQPNISITKLTPGADAEIKIEFAIAPEIEVGDYKKIAKKQIGENESKAEDVTDIEVDSVVLNLQREIAHHEYHQNHDAHDHSHGELDLPEVNNEFAQKVGQFQTVEEMKKAIYDNLVANKAQREVEKRRIKLIDEVIEKSKIKYPEFLLRSEQAIMLEELKTDVVQHGQPFSEYLKMIKKTEDEIKEERKEMADKRVKTQLVLSKIANEEKLKADQVHVDEQVAQILKMHVNADKDNVRMFVERFELNQLVWKVLEGK